MLSEKEIEELQRITKKENSSFMIIFLTIFFILTLFVSLSYYVKTAKLDIIAETQGTVIPSSKVKTVQHLEGGIVKKIFFNSGDIVKKGELLLELEPIKTLSNFSELEKELINLSINISRLKAESDLKTPAYDEQLTKEYPNLVEESKKLYDVRVKGTEHQFMNKNKSLKMKLIV